MNNTLHLPFFEVTRKVFELILDLQEISESAIAPGGDACSNLTISIGVIGDLMGDIPYTFLKETMLEVVCITTGGMGANEIDDFITSVIGEISSIISGKTTITLSEKDVIYDILPPKVIKSEEGVCVYPVDSNTKISTEIDSVGLEVRLQGK